MKLFLPKNIYSLMLAELIKGKENVEIIFKESSLISNELEKDQKVVGLIPSLDLINHPTLFISNKVGISFDGMLSNAYFYLSEKKDRALGKVLLRGDVSLNEIILSKILFQERFSSDIEVTLDVQKEPTENQNTLVVGNENYAFWNYENGISFSDQIADVIDLPYVNFIFVSHDNSNLSLIEKMLDNIDERITENLDGILSKLNYEEKVKLNIRENIGTVYFEITQNEVDALKELYRLVFYYGIIDDMFDLRFSEQN